MRLKEWPVGEGEMAGLIREHNWAATPLGPIEDWPQSLTTIVDMLVASEVSMIELWGQSCALRQGLLWIMLVMALLHSPQQRHGVSTHLRGHAPTSIPLRSYLCRSREVTRHNTGRQCH